MSDVDSLDELLDDMDDVDNMDGDDAKLLAKTPALTNQCSTVVQVEEVVDLDALLDDVTATYDYYHNHPAEEDDADDGGCLLGHLQSSKERAIDEALLGVPLHLRKKWTDYLHVNLSAQQSTEINTETSSNQPSRRCPSHAYQSWNEDTSRFAPEKTLKQILLKVLLLNYYYTTITVLLSYYYYRTLCIYMYGQYHFNPLSCILYIRIFTYISAFLHILGILELWVI